jgi:ActR/RegA family two-component response regulator
MPKRVLDVGNCDMDHGNLRALIEGSFDATLVRCHTAAQALAELRKSPADLLLVNRQLDHDLTEGIEVIRQVKGDERLRDTRCILITNFPEHQQAAAALGAEPGFGKRDLSQPKTRELLSKYLA